MSTSITSLSTDILQEICTLLCHHCQSDPNIFYKELDEDCTEIIYHQSNLSNLAISCKRLYDAAVPFLYHMPRPQRPRQAVRLLQTLSQQPGLAAHVKVLRLWRGCWGLRRDDINMEVNDGIPFRSLVAAAGLSKVASDGRDRGKAESESFQSHYESIYQDEHRFFNSNDVEGDEIDVAGKQNLVSIDHAWEDGDIPAEGYLRCLALSMAISFTSRLESIEIQLAWEDAGRILPLPRVSSLVHVKELVVVGSDNIRPHQTPDLQQLRLFLPHMPNLRVLRGYFLRLTAPVPLPPGIVTDLYLTEITVKENVFQKFMSTSFGCLRLFSWNESFNGDDALAVTNVRMDDILHALLKHDPSKLTHLRLAIRNQLAKSSLIRAARMLRDMPSLSTLDIAASFPGGRQLILGGEMSEDAAIFTNMLPSSLRALSLEAYPLSDPRRDDPPIWPPHLDRILHLARNAKQRCPNLQIVRLRLLDSQGQPVVESSDNITLSDVYEEFQGRGVLRELGDDDLWAYL